MKKISLIFNILSASLPAGTRILYLLAKETTNDIAI